MTEQKSLKKLVRERMSRTGESYTTAHRQVTSRKADRALAVHAAQLRGPHAAADVRQFADGLRPCQRGPHRQRCQLGRIAPALAAQHDVGDWQRGGRRDMS